MTEPPEATAPQSRSAQAAASIPITRSVVPPDNTLYETGKDYSDEFKTLASDFYLKL